MEGSLGVPFANHLIDADGGERIVGATTKDIKCKLFITSKLGFAMRIDKLDS